MTSLCVECETPGLMGHTIAIQGNQVRGKGWEIKRVALQHLAACGKAMYSERLKWGKV